MTGITTFREHFLHKNGIVKSRFARWYVDIENSKRLCCETYNANIIEAHDRMEAKSFCVLHSSEATKKLNFAIIDNAIKTGEIEKIAPVGRVSRNILSEDTGHDKKIVLEIKLNKDKRRKERLFFLIIGEDNFNSSDFIDDGDRLLLEIGGLI